MTVVLACCTRTRVRLNVPEFIILTGAMNMRHDGIAGTKQVKYEIWEPYPACTALKEISAQLTKQDYKPLKKNYLNPGQPSSHVTGWVHFVDRTSKPAEHVDQWLAQWQNAKGHIVQYTFQYRWQSSSPANKRQLIVYVTMLR